MTTEITPEISPAQARKELARRDARKGTAKRRNYPAKHIFDASTARLQALATTPVAATAEIAPDAEVLSSKFEKGMFNKEARKNNFGQNTKELAKRK
jgi:hypothetical protein